MAFKYMWQRSGLKPFILAGGSIRRINSFEGSRESIALIPGVDPSRIFRFQSEEGLLQGGGVVGSGVRFDIGLLKISPELRYTRWTSERFLPTRNQTEFLIGVMF
jgi:hypothetical protein